jgi:hypothetical protein
MEASVRSCEEESGVFDYIPASYGAATSYEGTRSLL